MNNGMSWSSSMETAIDETFYGEPKSPPAQLRDLDLASPELPVALPCPFPLLLCLLPPNSAFLRYTHQIFNMGQEAEEPQSKTGSLPETPAAGPSKKSYRSFK